MRIVPGQARRHDGDPVPCRPERGMPAATPQAPPLPTPLPEEPPAADPRWNRGRRRWLSLLLITVGMLLGLRLLAMPSRPAIAPASKPWTAQVAALTYQEGKPATLEVRVTLTNSSAEAVRRVQAMLLLPPPLRNNVVRTAYWDPLLEGGEIDYWGPQTGRTASFGLKLSGVSRDEALKLLEETGIKLSWSPAELDPQGTRLEQVLTFKELWPVR